MTKEKRLILVGILEGSGECNTSKLLESILLVSGYEVCFKPKDNFLLFYKEDSDYILLINIKAGKFSSFADIGMKFDIIIHTYLKPVDYENIRLKHILGDSKYILVNSDEENWDLLIKDVNQPIVITYGFNNKATITLSSYNIHDKIESNIYLQRKIQTINNKLIEPFELPIKTNTKDKLDIYLIIAAILFGLVLELNDFSMDSQIYFEKTEDEKVIIQK